MEICFYYIETVVYYLGYYIGLCSLCSKSILIINVLHNYTGFWKLFFFSHNAKNAVEHCAILFVRMCAYDMRDGTCVRVLAPCVCMVLYIGVRTQGRCKMTFLYDFGYLKFAYVIEKQ